MKRKIMRNLRTLEQEGMVNSENDYQDIINAIARVGLCGCDSSFGESWLYIQFSITVMQGYQS